MKHSLHQLALVDSSVTEDFDRFTRLATNILGVPVALVSTVDFDQDRQFFTSACGLSEPWASQRQTPLTHSFCKHVVTDGKPLIIEDARNHPLVRDNLAIPELNVIAYLGVPFSSPDGTILGALCAIDTKPRTWSKVDVNVLTDLAASVTNQIGLHDALITSRANERFGTVVENSHHEVFMFDPDTLKFTSVNKGARENLGYDLADIQMLSPVDIKPDFSQQDFESFIEPLLSGDSYELKFETRHERKDGSTYPVAIRLEYHINSDGSVFIAFCEDVTEKRRLEHALAEETKNFLAFFNYAPEPMSVSGMDTRILQANPACERLFGLASEDLIGQHFIDHVPEEYLQEVQLNFSKATPENPFYSVLMEQIMNGVPKILIWSNLIRFENGQPSKIYSIATDVTELHAAKASAEESMEEAKRAMEVRKVFLANMSHEVRTPLNAIMGLFQLIQMADVPERQKKQAEVGLNASHHLLAQLVNVLELSRVEANAVEIVQKPTDIRSLAEQWLETAAATNHRLGKPINVSFEVAENTPELSNLDARRVTQIVNNLTDNALKFTKQGRVAIHVNPVLNNVPSEGMTLEIAVSDTGCGIKTNESETIFERFVQIDDAQTRENSGSGLGLAISRELAELMGASLDVASPSPRSCFETTFSLRLQTDNQGEPIDVDC